MLGRRLHAPLRLLSGVSRCHLKNSQKELVVDHSGDTSLWFLLVFFFFFFANVLKEKLVWIFFLYSSSVLSRHFICSYPAFSVLLLFLFEEGKGQIWFVGFGKPTRTEKSLQIIMKAGPSAPPDNLLYTPVPVHATLLTIGLEALLGALTSRLDVTHLVMFLLLLKSIPLSPSLT